jgi:hypothetical protein
VPIGDHKKSFDFTPFRGEMFIDSEPKPLRLRSEERKRTRVAMVCLISAPPNGVDKNIMLLPIDISLLRSES